jgi:protein-S-isoprenylcysteine O-methyltransferase Ste14
VLVATAVAGFLLAAAAQRRAPRMAFATTGWGPTLLGVAIIWAGILLRGWAIATLGQFFRRDIQVAADQPVVSTGPYAAIRHPAYAGNMLTFAGAGVLLANWGSLAALVTVPLVGVVRRITIEEALVAGRLGEPYRRYAARTARLVPHVW